MDLNASHKMDSELQPVIENEQLILIYSLELNAFNKTKLFRCNKFNRIRFVPAPSLYGRDISLLTNYTDDYEQFDRFVKCCFSLYLDFYFDRFSYNEIDLNDHRNVLQLRACGSFHFYYADTHKPNNFFGSFYIVVNPEFKINEHSTLSLNSIQCQTVLSKCMGPIDTWKDKLKVSINSGYNFIHWTPIQELGASKSAYSLANQHRVNPNFCTADMLKTNVDCSLQDVGKIVNWLKDEHGILSLTDIVLNHTANESPWLKLHPESAYNCCNSPWFRPAFLLDRLLWHLTIDIEDGRWSNQGLVPELNCEYHLDQVRTIFKREYLPMVNLEEFYMLDALQVIDECEVHMRQYFFDPSNTIVIQRPNKTNQQYSPIKVIQDTHYRRFGSTIDFQNAIVMMMNEIEFVNSANEIDAVNRWIDFAISRVKEHLNRLNDEIKAQITDHLNNAVENVIKGARYERLSPDGPKLPKISKKTPLATQYFIDEINAHKNKDLVQIEQSLFDESVSCFYMAHNGWVMGDDPLRNFAEQDSWVYLRRELICWGDSVKLRYGEKFDDAPYLWAFMEAYVKQMASTFHGLRLDNCHSTPIHVAQYMLDAARRVNPDMYLIAELFTSSEEVDNIFINKLGINSLIREAMSAGIPFELGRQVYRFGGDPVGSFLPDNLKSKCECTQKTLYMRPFVPSVAHAILFDQTHDNESPIIRRSAYDPLPSAALVSMTYAATGSNRGLDKLVPHHIHVVNEDRQYSVWDDSGKAGVNSSSGIIAAKKVLNELHQFLGTHGFSQAFVDQRDRDTIVVTRHNPYTHQSVILVARTAFYHLNDNYAAHFEPLRIEGKFEKILFEMKMSGQPDEEFKRGDQYINGYKNFNCQVKLNVPLKESEMIDLEVYDNPPHNLVKFKHFSPSSVIAFSVSLLDRQSAALVSIRSYLEQYNTADSEVKKLIHELDLLDINYVLFRCNQEEVDESNGNGVYNLSNGPLIYCGLAGVMYHLARIRTHNDLGHPLCANLREGDWLPNYIATRLTRRKSTQRLAAFMQKIFAYLKDLPNYLVPRYFDSILLPLYTLILDQVWILSGEFVLQGDDFTKRLALGAVALIASHSPSPLPPLSPKSIPKTLAHLKPTELPTIAAGLPHFASGYMRNWGRDTFISFKGLLLHTGRYDVAKVILLGFAGTLRHGLIPNLLDGGRNSRYNCRDAVWWWLQSIKDYIQIAPDGADILDAEVRRIFPTDDSPALMADSEGVFEPLHKTMQEALERHFGGINFVERNHGKQIDAFMAEPGFHINIGVNRETGFVHGGNEWNCGTWMDKMGSSAKAGNSGHPATPRDGSAVEIVGLCKSIVTYLAELHANRVYPHEGVNMYDSSGKVIESWTYSQWANKIQENFERLFYIGDDCQDQHVNQRGIYKDTYKATKPWMDYQLRPNFLVTMCVAPELFDRHHAEAALEVVDEILLGPLGMKTLDSSDWNYRGDYDNSNDSDDYNIANGFNYHNGPEWLWPTGYYFMARLKFFVNHAHEINYISRLLAKHFEHLTNSDWFGLPELTNSNGVQCYHSCSIQAWSHATLLEMLHLKSFIEKNMFFFF